MRGFTPYPPAKKMRGRNDIRMVSNVGARRKWLEKYVPEWRGPEVWSEKQVKMYIDDIKSGKGYIPLAKKAKIPWAWDCRPIPIFVTVVEPQLEDQDEISQSVRELMNRMIIHHLDDGVYSDFV
jgi:hypothetical protein